jgi:hypothetical protein
MRSWFCLVALCVAGVSCHRETGPERPQAAINPLNTNVVSKVDDKGSPAETLVYTTNGLLKQHTFFETAADGRVLSARTVDAEGKPKWTEQYSYGETGGTRPVEVRRLKPDGKIIAVHFRSAPDGTEQRFVIGPDGKELPAAEQKAFLEE